MENGTRADGKFHPDVDGRENWPKEKAALEAELHATRASERSATMERLAMALNKGGATPAGCDLLYYHLDKRIRIETVEDKRTVQILQADGLTPMVGSGKDGLATFDDLVKEAAKQYPSFFEANGAACSGTSPNGQRPNTGGKAITRKDFDALDPVERHRKIVKEGYRVVDQVEGTEKPSKSVVAGGRTITRRDFEVLSPADRMAKMKDGFTVTE